MHILIGLITAVAGLIWAMHSLQNSGVNLNAFNPFTWMRRRKWEKQLGIKPMHALTSSMDAAALLVVAVAKEHGDITRESKLEILSLFEKEFGVKRNRSIEMYSSSVYMLQGALNMADEVRHILKPSKKDFGKNQVTKLLDMLNKTACLEDTTEGQKAIIKAVEQELTLKDEQPEKW